MSQIMSRYHNSYGKYIKLNFKKFQISFLITIIFIFKTDEQTNKWVIIN